MELVMLVKMYLVAYFRYCDFTGCEMILLQKLLIIFLDNLPCAGVRDPIREGILPEFLCLLLSFRQADLAWGWLSGGVTERSEALCTWWSLEGMRQAWNVNCQVSRTAVILVGELIIGPHRHFKGKSFMYEDLIVAWTSVNITLMSISIKSQ